MTKYEQNPKWRGFNLLDNMFMKSKNEFPEDDFRYISEWGFNFARIPMNYHHFIKDISGSKIQEEKYEPIDRVIKMGEKYNIHINLNFHRAPGYSVNKEYDEPYCLWKDIKALEDFHMHWESITKRYKGISNEVLSYNLINEPPAFSDKMSNDDHERVIRSTIEIIREIDSTRMLVVDGVSWGTKPDLSLSELDIIHSCRAYDPLSVSHYNAPWLKGSDTWAIPSWPAQKSDMPYNRKLLENHFSPWLELVKNGAKVHCGEGGAFNQTPHDVFLRWFEDVLDILKSHNICIALWNLRGSFGVLDSMRKDVDYHEFHDHYLDKKLLDLLMKH